MRTSASVTAAAMFVVLAGAAGAGTSEPVQLAPVDYAFIALLAAETGTPGSH
jgi:hypothetical protein